MKRLLWLQASCKGGASQLTVSNVHICHIWGTQQTGFVVSYELMVLCCAVLCCAVLCCAVLCCVVLCCVVLCVCFAFVHVCVCDSCDVCVCECLVLRGPFRLISCWFPLTIQEGAAIWRSTQMAAPPARLSLIALFYWARDPRGPWRWRRCTLD